jgi:hypothetical protein
MRPHTTSRPRRKHKRRGIAAALFLALAATAVAQESTPAPAPETRWALLPEPAFLRPDYAFPIAGTKATILTPALVKGDEVRELKKADAARLNLDMDSIRRVAAANASAELAKLTPDYVRDRHGVIQFAVLSADSPAVAGVVLAPDFLDRFADVFGPDILVAIPNRHRIYVYPALASKFQSTSELVLRDYETSGEAVSKEVFRVTKDGLRAVGSFELQ